MRRWSRHSRARSLSSARPAAAPGRRGPLRGGGHGHVVFQLRVFNEILAWLSLDLNVSGFAPSTAPRGPRVVRPQWRWLSCLPGCPWARSRWRCLRARSCCCPSPSSATRSCSRSLRTTTCSGWTAPWSTVSARLAAAPGASPHRAARPDGPSRGCLGDVCLPAVAHLSPE